MLDFEFDHVTTRTTQGATTVLTNPVSGVSVRATPNDDATVYVVDGPALPGKDGETYAFTASDAGAARNAYLERNLRWLAATVGETYVFGATAEKYGSREAGLGIPEAIEKDFDALTADIEEHFDPETADEIVAEAMRDAGFVAEFPGTKRIVDTNGRLGQVYFVNEAAGVSVTSYTTSAGAMLDVEAAPIDGEDEVFNQATIDFDDAQAAYAERWLRSAAVKIGLGFNPDTPAADYVTTDPDTGVTAPGLGERLAPLLRQYDAMIGFCHQHLEDPYEIGMDAWKKADMIPEPVDSQPPAMKPHA